MGNKLIAILVAVMLVVVIVVGIVTRENHDQIAPIDANEPTTPTADADSTVTTLQTLVAKLNAMEKDKAADNERIARLEAQLSHAPQNIDTQHLEQNIIDKTLASLKDMKQSATDVINSSKTSDNSILNLKELDTMFGGSDAAYITNDAVVPFNLSNSKSHYQTIGALKPLDGASIPVLHKSPKEPEPEPNQAPEKKTITPVYTIPQLAMDINAQAITSIIGRIPNVGTVRDAFFFKAISSADVLTANGHNLPHIEGVIWEGTAIGDRTLGCVQGHLDKVSLIFPDGTIATSNVGGRIGYIADEYGQACVRGKLISNAGRLLFARISARALEAAAQAEAAAQTITSETALTGNTKSQVVNRGDYIKAKTAAGGMDELVKFVRDRMSDAFDAIYVEPGIKLQIHLQQQVNFDFDKNGRKLVHTVTRQGKHVFND